MEKHGTRCVYYAHASVGLLHFRPELDLKDAGDRERFRSIAREVADLVAEYGGSLSGSTATGGCARRSSSACWVPRCTRRSSASNRPSIPRGSSTPKRSWVLRRPSIVISAPRSGETRCPPISTGTKTAACWGRPSDATARGRVASAPGARHHVSVLHGHPGRTARYARPGQCLPPAPG